MGQFKFEIKEGTRKGAFSIYQSKEGNICMAMGNQVTSLSRNQVEDLKLPIYELEDFDYDAYKLAYDIM